MKKLNDRSCVLDSFAYILGTDPLHLARRIYGNGENGYHTQQLIEIASQMGWAVTMFERKALGQNPVTGKVWEVIWADGGESRFSRNLFQTKGVLLGRTPWTNRPHAVAWKDPYAHDPAIDQKYTIIDPNGRVNDVNFMPLTFLRMDEL